MSLSNLIEFTKRQFSNSDQSTTEIYTNYDSQYPTKVLVSNEGYKVEDLYVKNGFSLVAFTVGILIVNTLLELTK